jgi:hypothetical protein
LHDKFYVVQGYRKRKSRQLVYRGRAWSAQYDGCDRLDDVHRENEYAQHHLQAGAPEMITWLGNRSMSFALKRRTMIVVKVSYFITFAATKRSITFRRIT